MDMYCTEKVGMPEYFRVELIQLVSVTRKKILEEIQKWGD